MRIETTLDEMRDSYDWPEAFEYASGAESVRGATMRSFTLDDVAEILGSVEGANDEADWLCVGRLNNGEFFVLSAGCDYTGWDCRAGGWCHVEPSLDELIQYGIPNRDRTRLDIPDFVAPE